MKLSSQEIGVVAVLVVIGAVVLCGYFLAKPDDTTPAIPGISAPLGERDESSVADEPANGEHRKPPRRPIVELSTKEVSFGAVDPYTVRTADVTVKNAGTATLEVHGVRSSCGCVKPRIKNERVKPGKETTVHIEFDPQHYHANNPRIAVLLYTNDPLRLLSKIVVSADIEPEFTIEPPELDLGDVPAGEERSATVYVQQRLDEELEILRVDAPGLAIESTFREVASSDDGGRRRYAIDVRVPPEAKPGSLNGKLIVSTNIKRLPRTTVDVKGRIVGVEAVPATIHFGSVRPDRGEVARLILRGPYEFEVTGIETDMEGFQLEVDDEIPKEKHTVRIVMDGDVALGAKHGEAHLIAHANGKDQRISVQVHGLVSQSAGASS